jgi:hypothetical protein
VHWRSVAPLTNQSTTLEPNWRRRRIAQRFQEDSFRGSPRQLGYAVLHFFLLPNSSYLIVVIARSACDNAPPAFRGMSRTGRGDGNPHVPKESPEASVLGVLELQLTVSSRFSKESSSSVHVSKLSTVHYFVGSFCVPVCTQVAQ